MIQLKQEHRTGWLVVSATGRADAEAADELQNGLIGALELSARVAADFSALDYISSAGVRAVLQAARAAQTRNAEFAVCGLSAPVRKVFDMSGLHHVLEIHGELPC